MRNRGARLRLAMYAGGLAAALALPAGARTIVVTADGMAFTPPDVTIYQGDSIRFMNYGGVHNVHADNNRFVCSINCTTNNTPSDEPWSVVVRFTTLGTFGYFCDQHGNLTSGMRGSITVVDGIFTDGFDTGPSPD